MAEERNRPPQKPETEDDGRNPADAGQHDGDGQGLYEPNRRPDAGEVSRGMIAAWGAMGVLLGIFSLIIVFFLYSKRDAAVRAQAIRFTLMGIGIGLILEIMLLQYMMGDAGAGATAGDGAAWTSTNF